jgi:hypothetical protein
LCLVSLINLLIIQTGENTVSFLTALCRRSTQQPIFQPTHSKLSNDRALFHFEDKNDRFEAKNDRFEAKLIFFFALFMIDLTSVRACLTLVLMSNHQFGARATLSLTPRSKTTISSTSNSPCFIEDINIF